MGINAGVIRKRQIQRAARNFTFFRLGSGKIYMILNGKGTITSRMPFEKL